MGKKKETTEIIPSSLHPIFRQFFCYSLTKSGVLYKTILESSMKKYNIVGPQSGILHILADRDGYNQLLLGQEMNIDKASMVKFIDGLEKEELVERKVDPNDRRAKLISLTSKGKRVQKKLIEVHSKLEEEVFGNFSSSEKEMLKEVMPRVLESILSYLNTQKS